MMCMCFICRLHSAQNKPSNLNVRFAWFIGGLNFGVIFGVTWIYPLLGFAFFVVPKEYQWMLALSTPLIREFWVWIGPKVCFKSCGSGSKGKLSTKLICQHYMETKHAVFLAVILGGVATSESTYCILAVDFVLNMIRTWKIVSKPMNQQSKSKEIL